MTRRKALRCLLPVLVTSLLLVDAPAEPMAVHAAGMVVNTLADADPPVTDGLCSLREAIANANDNAATYLDCPAGTGADTITFSLGGTIPVASQLPDITDTAGLTIEGGSQDLTVSGGGTVQLMKVTSGAVLIIRNLALEDGRAYGGVGGAIWNDGGMVTIEDSTLSRNRVTWDGGAIFNRGTLTIRRSNLEENYANDGGGIFNSGVVTIIDSTLTGNSAFDGGGGLQNGYGDEGAVATILRSLFVGNAVAHYGPGGAISNPGGASVEIVNSTLSGNSGYIGTGSIFNRGSLSLVNSTVVGNYSLVPSGPFSGGIYNRGSASLKNVILAQNGHSSAPQDCDGTFTAAGTNIITVTTGCTVIGGTSLVADPQLGALADNGGPTLTHAPLAGSLALGNGDGTICAAPPVNGVDQRGAPRLAGTRCDVGAYESAEKPLLNGTFELGATHWTLSSTLDGIARVETEGSCFGANNTMGVTINGTRALNVRSSPGAPLGSTGIATSLPFTLGPALTFRALSENDDAIPSPNPVSVEVRILDLAGALLATHTVKPSILTTSPGTTNDGCLVGDLRDGPWSTHSIDTSAYAGQVGRVEFRQHTNVPGKGFFTLVDYVVVVP